MSDTHRWYLQRRGTFSAPLQRMLLPLRAYALSLASLLAGAATVHVAFAPDLRLPLRQVAAAKQLPLPDDLALASRAAPRERG